MILTGTLTGLDVIVFRGGVDQGVLALRRGLRERCIDEEVEGRVGFEPATPGLRVRDHSWNLVSLSPPGATSVSEIANLRGALTPAVHFLPPIPATKGAATAKGEAFAAA